MRTNLLKAFLAFCVIGLAAMGAQGQSQPDLIVRSAAITKFQVNNAYFVKTITVVVSNACLGSSAGASYVLVTFKTSEAKDAKAIFFIGNTVKMLKGGESYVQTFDVEQRSIGAGRHILIEVDPYKKVLEASEDNNWRSLNPNGGSTLLTQSQCSPKM